MDFRQIKNFLTLCETLNFRRASVQINIVQPALSRQMQLLEKEVGALLFNRSKRTVTLTEAGIFFKKETTRILQDMNKTMIRTAQLHTGEAGLGISIEPISSMRGVSVNIKIIELKHIPQKVEMILFWLRVREEELKRLITMF